jgi:hypothetical protein
MGLEYPKYPGDVSDGDERAYSPHKTTDSLLATERGTDYTRRIETDANRNLYVNVAASPTTAPSSVSALAGGMIPSVPATTLTTLATYTATVPTKITRIGCSGTCYAKYQLVLNTSIIETKRSGPERSIDFVFERPLNLLIGDILDIKVTHYVTSSLEDFEATIYGG